MEAAKILSMKDNEKIIAEATKCMLEAYAAHEEEVSAQLGITEFNGETGRILGQKIGLKMATYCPDYLMKMGTAAQGNPAQEPTYQLVGKILSVEQGEFISYKLKDNEGKVHKLLWYQHFIGSDEFTDEPKKLVGKEVTVSVKDVECYVPKAKGYFSIKEIVALTLE